MKGCKKKLLGIVSALFAVCSMGAVAGWNSPVQADADSGKLSYAFTDTMDGAAFKAPTSHYGWKVAKGVLSPDNSLATENQIGYLEEAIALNESKYISLDFAPSNEAIVSLAKSTAPIAFLPTACGESALPKLSVK